MEFGTYLAVCWLCAGKQSDKFPLGKRQKLISLMTGLKCFWNLLLQKLTLIDFGKNLAEYDLLDLRLTYLDET